MINVMWMAVQFPVVDGPEFQISG